MVEACQNFLPRFESEPPITHQTERETPTELTPREQATLDDAWNDIAFAPLGFNTDELTAKRCQAEQAILAIGARALPYLRDRIDADTNYEFACLVDAIAGDAELDFVLQTLREPLIIADTDLSAVGRLHNYLMREIGRLRKNGETSRPQLEHIATALIEILGLPDLDTMVKDDLCLALALTNTRHARDYLAVHGLEEQYGLYAADPGRIFEMHEPFHFQTLEEITRGYEYYGRPEITEKPTISIETKADQTSFVAKKIESLVDNPAETDLVTEPTALSAVKLHLYNYATQHPGTNDEDLKAELRHINRLSKVEREYSQPGNPLPTIGIEIEIPKINLNRQRIAVLDALSIKNEDANDLDRALWEVNPSFSYSPHVPARILQELTVLGAIPLEPRPGAIKLPFTTGVPKDALLSLHINLGIPGEIKNFVEEQPFNEEAHIMNDVITYAFSSPHRLRNRKNPLSLDWKGDIALSRKTTVLPLETEQDAAKIFPHPELTGSIGGRLELKATEFRDFPTFRLLFETQKLGAMFFSHCKFTLGQPTSATERQLAKLWDNFHEEALQTLYKKNLFLPNMIDRVDEDREFAIQTLENTNLKKECRSLCTRYAQKVAEILHESPPL